MRSAISLVLTFLTISAHAQDDYRIYHRLINNAERCFFLEGKTDSAYRYYDMAFAKFDFVFAKDCFMAAQIAYYNKNDKYIPYLEKGFKNGLRPQHLKLSAVFLPLAKDSIVFDKSFPNYRAFRKTYLKRVNVELLRKTITLCAKDQSQKQHVDTEYAPVLYNTILSFEALIKSFGFPGEKLTGLSQPDIMQELGFTKQDYRDYPYGHNMDMDYEYIAQSCVLPLLIHQRCTYQMFAKYWLPAIISGQIHPRQVAMLYDHTYVLGYLPHKFVEIHKCFYGQVYGCYKINDYVDYTIINYGRHTIDSMRTALFINTYEVDSAQKTYIQKHGFKSTVGFFERE